MLRREWVQQVGDMVEDLEFNDEGVLAVVLRRDYCSYTLTPGGNLLGKVCGKGKMTDVSHYDSNFAFSNADSKIYITDGEGILLKKMGVREFNKSVAITRESVLACGKGCTQLDLDGVARWVLKADLVSDPAYYKGYWYASDMKRGRILIINSVTGHVVNVISHTEGVWDMDVCGNYLVASTYHYLYLYDVSDPVRPKEVWRRNGFFKARRVSFGPGCKYLAVTDSLNHELKVLDLEGRLVFSERFGDSYKDEVTAVAWWEDKVAVGLYDGRLYMYSVNLP